VSIILQLLFEIASGCDEWVEVSTRFYPGEGFVRFGSFLPNRYLVPALFQ